MFIPSQKLLKLKPVIAFCKITMTNVPSLHLPYFAEGKIVKGFGRGSKELGIPTANFSADVVDKLPPEFSCGVYYGWAQVENGAINKMVMSVGWNPFYENEKKSMETHILNKFDDLYGMVLKVLILGYIRPEKSFNNLKELLNAINDDIEYAQIKLDIPENVKENFENYFDFKKKNNL